MILTYDLFTVSYCDTQTGYYWFEIGWFEKGKWRVMVVSGIRYDTVKDANEAADLQVERIKTAFGKRYGWIKELRA